MDEIYSVSDMRPMPVSQRYASGGELYVVFLERLDGADGERVSRLVDSSLERVSIAFHMHPTFKPLARYDGLNKDGVMKSVSVERELNARVASGLEIPSNYFDRVFVE